MKIDEVILSECSAMEAVKTLQEQINMRDINIMLLKKKIMDSMPLVQLYHESKLESDKLLKEMCILKEENSKYKEDLKKSLIENLTLNKDHNEVSKKHEVMEVEYDELLLKAKGQAFHIKQLKNLTDSLETKIEASVVDAQLNSANLKEELAKVKTENVTLQKTVCRLNSTNEKKILYLYDFITFLGDSVASGILSKPQKQKLKRCQIHAKLLRSKSQTVKEESILGNVDESSVLDVDESHGPFSCASSVDTGLGSSVCTSDDEKYPSTATTPTRDSCVSPMPPSFAFTLPTSSKLTYLPKQYTDASTSPLKFATRTVGSDPICLERNTLKVNVATSPIKELQIDNLKPVLSDGTTDDIEDSTVRDILSKASHPFKMITPIPFNEAMDSNPVAEVVAEPLMKTKDNIFKRKKKKKFQSLFSFLSVMTKTMIKEELQKINPISSTLPEKSNSENNDPIKETKNIEKQVIILNNSKSTESSQLTLPNQSGYIIINTAPGTIYHMSPPAVTPAPSEESNSAPGSSKHPKHSTNTEFADICDKHKECCEKLQFFSLQNRSCRNEKYCSSYQSEHSQEAQKPKFTPKHFPSTSHEFKEKRKTSNKINSKDLFSSDDDAMNDQQTRQLRRSPRTSLSDGEDRCSSVELDRFHKHSDSHKSGKYNLNSDKQSLRSKSPRMSFSDSKKNNSSDLERVHKYFNSETRRFEKNYLKNDQRFCKPHDDINEEVTVERVSKYIDSKIQQSENKNDIKNRRSRRSPRTSFSDKKDRHDREIKKTLLLENVDSDSETCRSDKNNLNTDQQTRRSRRNPNMILSDERDHYIYEDNIAVTVVDKYFDLKKSGSNKREHETSRPRRSPRTSFSDKNDYSNNRKNASSELQRVEKCFDSEFNKIIKDTQMNDKQSNQPSSSSDCGDRHISENDDPVEVEKDIHKSIKNKRKRKFSESFEPLSKIKILKEMSGKSNVKSGQLSSSFENQNSSCVEFAQTNANVIDVHRKKSLSFSDSSVNTNNYGHENNLQSKKRISLCARKKNHIETVQSIQEDKETCQRVTRQSKSLHSPAQLLSSPRQRLSSVSELSSDCNITDVGSPSSKRLKMDARSIPKIANSPMKNPSANIVPNIDLENIKKIENAKIVLARLHVANPTQERVFLRKKLPEVLKRPLVPVNPVTMQEPTKSNVREDVQTIAEIPLNVINVPTPEVRTNINQRINNSWNMNQTEMVSDENNQDVGNAIFKSMLVNYIQEKKSRKRVPKTYSKPENLCDKLEKYLASQYSEENLDEFIESIYEEQVEDIGCAIVEFLSNHNRHKDIPVGMNNWSSPQGPVYQARLLNFLNRLHASPPPHYETSLIELVMKGIEYQTFRLNETPHVMSLKSLSYFYALLCKLTEQKDRLKIFCMDALYCLSFSAAPVVFCVLQSWQNLFPHSSSLAAKDPLTIVIVHFLLSHFSTRFLYCADPLKNLLFKKYGYATGSITDDEILKQLLERVQNNESSPYNESISMAFVLLGKRLGVDWCHKNIIQNGLLPRIMDESSSPHCRAMAAHLVGPLVRPFSTTMHLNLQVITKIYENRLQHGDDPLVEDALISSMTYFAKTNLPSMVGSMLKWQPKQPVSEHTRSLLSELLFIRSHGQWNRLIKANSKKWGVYISYSKKMPALGKNKSVKTQGIAMDVNS